jgi:hypothetical protein
MSEWNWFTVYHQDALARGDAERGRLLTLHCEAYEQRENDPDRMLALLAEGRHRAVQLGEPWWVLLFDHWKVHTLIYHKCDFRDVLELAVKNVLEVRKPIHQAFPMRMRVASDLVMAYLEIDPLGYADEVVKALDFLTTELTTEMDSSPYLLLECRRAFLFVNRQFDECHRIGLDCLARADTDPNRHTARHHTVATYAYLSRLAYELKDWPGLRNWATLGEELSRQMGYLHPLARFILWQAMAAEQEGDAAQATRLCRNAISRMTRLGKPPSGDYFEALAGFHEKCGEMSEALQVREVELKTIRDRGRLAYECDVKIKLCRLRSRMGLLQPADVDAARQAAAKLRKPARYLEELQEAIGGGMP